MKAFEIVAAQGVYLLTPELIAALNACGAGVGDFNLIKGFVVGCEISTDESSGESVATPMSIQFVNHDSEIEMTTIGYKVLPKKLTTP